MNHKSRPVQSNPALHAENATLLQFLSLESKMVQQRNMQLRWETNFLKNINRQMMER